MDQQQLYLFNQNPSYYKDLIQTLYNAWTTSQWETFFLFFYSSSNIYNLSLIGASGATNVLSKSLQEMLNLMQKYQKKEINKYTWATEHSTKYTTYGTNYSVSNNNIIQNMQQNMYKNF